MIPNMYLQECSEIYCLGPTVRPSVKKKNKIYKLPIGCKMTLWSEIYDDTRRKKLQL